MTQALDVRIVDRGSEPPWTGIEAVTEVQDGIRAVILEGGTASGAPAVALAIPLGNVSIYSQDQSVLRTSDDGYVIVQLTAGSFEALAAALRGARERWGS
jgi:hypothetical protein